MGAKAEKLDDPPLPSPLIAIASSHHPTKTGFYQMLEKVVSSAYGWIKGASRDVIGNEPCRAS